MYKDEYDLEVTCAGDAAMTAYLSGMDVALQFDRSGIEEFTEAVTFDEEFALAHAALGRQLFLHGSLGESTRHLKLALNLADRVSQREQDAVQVAEAAARSDPSALVMAHAHVATYPQDVFVLAHLIGPFGMMAFSETDDWCAQNVALLEATRSAYRADDWWHMTNRGFFGAEQCQLTQSRQDCERAWTLSENGNCAHSMAHLHFEAGALDEGKAFLKDWVSTYGNRSVMRHHLCWHLSLLDLDSGEDIGKIYEMYDRELDPKVNDPAPLETFGDNASFLWRCYMSGHDIPLAVRRDLLIYAETNLGPWGFPFADMHRAMATALNYEDSSHSETLEKLRDVSKNSGTRAAECVLRFASGFGAFVNQAYADAIDWLEPVIADSVLIGGSNPQRRIIEETYLEACVRAGQYAKARGVLQRRNRKSSVFDKQLLRKLNG